MAPVRRYLRISKYSVLECRIYLDNPALAQSWLLNPRNPILPQVIESIRPLVLPKLREERERSRKKSTKKKNIKDVIVKDEFEVSMFLTETSTRHSLLVKHKHFHEKGPAKIKSNSSKLIGESEETPVDVDAAVDASILREEDSDEDGVRMSDIPLGAPHIEIGTRRRRGGANADAEDFGEEGSGSAIEVNSDSDEGPAEAPGSDADEDEDKKKLAMDVSYEGFAIYGRVLCLVVKKKDPTKSSRSTLDSQFTPDGKSAVPKPDGQARMENWITSTQIPVGEDVL